MRRHADWFRQAERKLASARWDIRGDFYPKGHNNTRMLVFRLNSRPSWRQRRCWNV